MKTPAWADSRPLKTVSRNKSGVVIGASDGQLLIDTSMDSVAVLGPCRSGKSSTIVVPSLLTWRESAVVTDVHGKLFSITEHWRRTEAHSEICRLAFGDPSSPDTFNFLDAIPPGTPGELAEIQALAVALLGDGREGNDFWRSGAQALLTLFIVAIRVNPRANLHDVQQAVADDAAFKAVIAAYQDLIPGAGDEVGQAARATATSVAMQTEAERAGVRAALLGCLAIFASPDVARNTSCSSFELAKLRDGTAAMTVYMTFAAHDLARLQPLIRAFLSQVVRHGTREQPQASTHRLLLVLDDLAALGKLPFLESSLGPLAHYGIKPLLTIQSVRQLDRAYGKENRVWAQCAIRAVLAIDEVETAVAVADEIAGILARDGEAETERGQPFSTDELLRLGRHESIILGAVSRPIRATALPYYEDAEFKARVRPSKAGGTGTA